MLRCLTSGCRLCYHSVERSGVTGSKGGVLEEGSG